MRRERGGRRDGPRVGHAGTLDPFATGLLLVLLGRATRAQRFLMALEKTYEVVARFGAVSTTGDTEGEVVPAGPQPPRAPEPLVLPHGVLRQRPPAFSAVKVGGERAYRLARRGEEVELAEREVVVHEARELWRDGPRVALRLRCSAGTYVRSYVADLGDAYCQALRRTAIGPFVVPGGEPVELSLRAALGLVLPVRALDGDSARRLGHGQTLEGEADGPQLAVDPDDEPVAVVEPRDGALRPTVGFRA